MQLLLLDIQPSQFYISREKLSKIREWFDPNDLSNFEPLPVKFLNGRYIFTDGHTRAFAAYLAGLETVPLAEDTDELDWEMYGICVDAARNRGVQNVADFDGRVLQPDEYNEKWNGWCDVMHEVVELQRAAKHNN